MTSVETGTLYRPVGPEELRLVMASGWKKWPPRLPGQSLFYPVTSQQYAREITERWNVTQFGAERYLMEIAKPNSDPEALEKLLSCIP